MSRLNSLRHGLLAKLPVIVALGETEEDWENFRAAVIEDLSPVGVVQLRLAETVASLSWRMARAAKFDAAVAGVTFRAAAALGEPPADPAAAPDPDAVGVLDVRRQLARAGENVEAHELVLAFFEGLTGVMADVPLAPRTVAAAWEACCRAGGWDPEYDGPGLAGRFLAGLGVPQEDCYGDRAFVGWTTLRLRAGVEFLADCRGYPVAGLPGAVAGWLRYQAEVWCRTMRWCEAEIVRLQGERAAKRVAAALEASARGPEWLNLIAGYERGLSAELARTLSLLTALQAARPGLAAIKTGRAEAAGMDGHRG